MVKRRGDKTPEPPGGRALERLRLFEEARGIAPKQKGKKPQGTAKQEPKADKGEACDAKQVRRKD